MSHRPIATVYQDISRQIQKVHQELFTANLIVEQTLRDLDPNIAEPFLRNIQTDLNNQRILIQMTIEHILTAQRVFHHIQ
jgi:hypothetical protein